MRLSARELPNSATNRGLWGAEQALSSRPTLARRNRDGQSAGRSSQRPGPRRWADTQPHSVGPRRARLCAVVHAGLRGWRAAPPRAAPGISGAEGHRPRRHRSGPQQPGAGHLGRLTAVDLRQPVLRPAQRPHDLAVGHASTVDGGRARWRLSWHPDRGARPQHRGRPARLVHRPGLLQRPPRLPGGRSARPGPRHTTRCRIRRPGCLSPCRVGGRHLPRPTVRSEPAEYAPGPGRRRRFLSSLLHSSTRWRCS